MATNREGSLHAAMVREVQRVLKEMPDLGMHSINKAAALLGVSSRVIYKWLQPVEKGGWPELQPTLGSTMEKLQKKVAVKKAKKAEKKAPKKKLAKTRTKAAKPAVKA